MAATSTTRTAQVIEAARVTRSAMAELEVELLLGAVEWVQLNPGSEVDTSIEWGMRELEIAGDGAPTIDEGAVAEFALAVGLSTDAGRRYLGDAVELAHRLPRIWRRVVSGEVAVWKARKVAQATTSLPPEAASFVDRALYFVLKRCSFAEIERQVARARQEFDPAETERRRVAALEKRHFDIDLRQISSDGLVHIDGDVDLADALALEELVRARASSLDPQLPLDVRRAMAIGLLGPGDAGATPGREVMVYVHTRPGQSMVDVDNTRSTVTVEHLREWCQRAGAKVTVRPVIDLGEELSTDSYAPTDLMKEQVRLRHPECPFPGCHRPSRPGQKGRDDSHVPDLDHRVEFPEGRTTSSNLFPPCRGHHRLKTFTDWTYDQVPGGGFVWTSPLGHRHLG